MKIVTHSGHFHADELLAIAALSAKYPDAEIIRSRDGTQLDSADIVVDVGRIYDPAKLRFDHHQPEGAGKRENGIPYASFGLVWKKFGVELAGSADAALIIEEKLAMPIDALDNGIHISTPSFDNIQDYTLGDFFESFTAGLDSFESLDLGFNKALSIARELLEREIKIAQSKIADLEEVRKIYDETADKRLIVLPKAMSWKKILIPSEATFVLYPRLDDSWAVQAVPKSATDLFDRKCSLPAAWGGYGGAELKKITGVSDAIFCHRNLWLAAAETKEGALRLAEIALNP